MKRNLTIFALAAALTLGITGCTMDKAPNVTPTPTPATSSPSAAPEGAHRGTNMQPTTPGADYTNNGVYSTDRTGHVDQTTRNGANGVGNVVKGTVDGVGDVVRGVGQGVEDVGNGIRNATR